MLPFFALGLLSSSLTLEVFTMFTEGFSPLLEVPSPFPEDLSSWLDVSKRFTGGLSSWLEMSLLLTEGFSPFWDGAFLGDSDAFASAEGPLPSTLSWWGLDSSGSSYKVTTLSLPEPKTTTYGLTQGHRIRCHATLNLNFRLNKYKESFVDIYL